MVMSRISRTAHWLSGVGFPFRFSGCFEGRILTGRNYLWLKWVSMLEVPTLVYFTDAGKNLGTSVKMPQSGGAGPRHHKFPGASSDMPINQYLLVLFSGTLLAIRAVTAPPPGIFSTRTCKPGVSGLGKRTPQP